MGRKKVWPPTVYHDAKRNTARCRVQNQVVTLGPWGSAKADARYAAIVAAGPDGAPPRKRGQESTVAGLVGGFMAWAAGYYPADGREAASFASACNPLLALYGPHPAGEFTPALLKRLREAMISGSWMPGAMKERYARLGKPTTWSLPVVNRRIGRVKAVFRWGVEEGLVPAGVWQALLAVRALPPGRSGARVNVRPRAPDEAAVEAVAAFATRPVAAMVRVQFLAGMRPGEVRRMRTMDIDRGDPDAWVYRPGSDQGPHGAHKNAWRGQLRQVALGPRARAVIEPFLDDRHPAKFLFRPADGVRDRKGKGRRPGQKATRRKTARRLRDHYTGTAYPQAVARACKKAGVPNIYPYLLRHAAKNRFEKIFGTETARAVLGQKTVDSTALYGDLDLAGGKEAAAKIG